MPLKARKDGAERQERSLEWKQNVLDRALNKDESGETIAQISQDTGASESVIYLLLQRHREGKPLDLRGQPPPPKSPKAKAKAREAIARVPNKSDREEAERTHIANLMHDGGRRFGNGMTHSVKAEFSIERQEDMPLELEVMVLRKRVKQLEAMVLAWLNN